MIKGNLFPLPLFAVVWMLLFFWPVFVSATTIGNSITVTNNATISGNVTTTNVTSSGYIEVGKVASFNASYTNGDLNVGNQLVVDGAVYASSTLEVSGVSIFWNTVRPSGNDSQDLGLFGTAWNEFFVSGTSYIDGVSSTSGLYPTANNSYDIGDYNQAWNDIFASGTVRIGDTATLSQGSAGGDLNVGNNLVVDGTANVSSTLQVTGNLRTYGALTADTSVSSTIVTSSRHIGIGQVDSSNANWAGGSLNVGNRLSVDGATFVSSTLDVTGVAQFWANVRPGGNNSQDLGAYGNAWKEIFASSTAYLAGVSTTGGIYPTANNSVDLGGYTRAFKDVYVSSSLFANNVTSTGFLTIGAPGTLSFANGALNVGGVLNVEGAMTFTNTMLSTGLSHTFGVLDTSDTFTVRAVAAFDGNTTLGNATTTDITYFNSRLASSLIPTQNNSISLGEFSRAYTNVFASGTLFAATTTMVNTTGSSTLQMRSNATGAIGAQIILEDVDNDGCTAITVLNGVISGSIVTCPSI